MKNETLILVRGLSGSGKSTLAKHLSHCFSGAVHLEADDFFMKDGIYTFDQAKLSEAHQQCQRRTREALKEERPVIVANTFTRVWEMQPYLDMVGGGLLVMRTTGPYTNAHGLSVEKLDEQCARFEDYPGELFVSLKNEKSPIEREYLPVQYVGAWTGKTLVDPES